MLIVSDKHDYYDSVMRLGVDKTCVYTRKMAERFDDEPEYKGIFSVKPPIAMTYLVTCLDRFRNQIGNIRVEKTGYIFFCGSCYPFLNLHSSDARGYNKHSVFAFSQQEADRFVDFFGTRKDIEEYNKKSRITGADITYDRPLPLRRQNVRAVFSNIIRRDNKIVDFHHKVDSPIVVFDFFFRNHKITVNPVLKDYEFYKVLDPYTTFQELSMFVSGVMGGRAPKMEKVSDEVRLEKHGFDKRTSFRKL